MLVVSKFPRFFQVKVSSRGYERLNKNQIRKNFDVVEFEKIDLGKGNVKYQDHWTKQKKCKERTE